MIGNCYQCGGTGRVCQQCGASSLVCQCFNDHGDCAECDNGMVRGGQGRSAEEIKKSGVTLIQLAVAIVFVLGAALLLAIVK